MEFLPFRIEFNAHTGEAHISGRFKLDIAQIPDPELTRKQILASLEADLMKQGLPEDLAQRRDSLNVLVADLSNQVEQSKANIHRLADQRDKLWADQIPTVEALERADQAIDQEKQRYGNLLAHLDGAKVRLDDLGTIISNTMRVAARNAIAKATEFTPAERKAIDQLLGLFTGTKSEALISACQRQRMQYDFLPGDRGGGWIGSVDSTSARVAQQLLSPAAAPAEDGGDGEGHIEAEVETVEVTA